MIVLDSGGYGPVTISQAVSLIAPPGVYAGISVFSGTGISVNAGASDVVTIRGLTLNGLGGADGIDFTSGAALYVEDSTFKNLSTIGIWASTSANASLVVEGWRFRRLGAGVQLQTSSGTIQATVDGCRFVDGFDGIEALSGSNVVVRDSASSRNSQGGFIAFTGSQLDVENSLTTHNVYGLAATGGGNMRSSETTIEENTNGVLANPGSTVVSFGNNRLAGNGTNGSFSSTIPLQ